MEYLLKMNCTKLKYTLISKYFFYKIIICILVVTLYATLGEEAIAHGINETEVTLVITSHDLLPKFKKILELTPRVKTLIYMEDKLAKTDVTGYKDGVEIISFKSILKKGSEFTVTGKF